ncbi:hypothetical protein [Aeromicrobium sp. UC242_57]|uniref:hypothetical protein n=1 Tax=Aeromicrobium sp. UC242_57 TaxID=3374624 RepID=UPI0037BAF2EE
MTARRTQQERSATTRALVIDARPWSCWSRSATPPRRSRGSRTRRCRSRHLAPSFSDPRRLLVAAVEDVAARRLHVLPDGAAPGATGWDAAVDLVWRDLQSPNFLAVLRLWVAARTDDDLRAALVPVERTVFESVHRAVTTVADDDDPACPRSSSSRSTC